MSGVKHYEYRDAMQLDEAGEYYFRHVMAMTAENLHSKSDIAAQLGYRDQQIDTLLAAHQRLEGEVERVRAANLDCVDHFNQMKADLERANALLREIGEVCKGEKMPTGKQICHWGNRIDAALRGNGGGV